MEGGWIEESLGKESIVFQKYYRPYSIQQKNRIAIYELQSCFVNANFAEFWHR